jgi:hypothetical protein
MSKSAINLEFAVGAGYAPISTAPRLFKGSATNYCSRTIYVRGEDAQGNVVDVPGFPPGFTQDYSAVDLSTIYLKGTAPDTLTLVGEAVERMVEGALC